MSIIEKALGKRAANPETGKAVEHGARPPAGPADTAPARLDDPRAPKGGAGVHKGPVFSLDMDRLAANGLLTPEDARSPLAEEFRLLKRPILNNAFGHSSRYIHAPNLVMFTSSLPGEGKTFCSLNLALSISRELDRTVLLVDADVAKPALPHYLGIDSQPGLLDVLNDNGPSLSEVIIRTDIPNLSIIPSGTQHGRSTELLGSEQMARLTAEMAERYPDRIVLFDSPPLLSASEASVLAEHMGQIVMVVEAERTPESAFKQAMELLGQCDVVMTLLNKTANAASPGYGYGYGYGYGEQT